MKRIPLIFITLFLLTSCEEKILHETNFTKYVNPMIGTDFHGHTFPGAIAPFGMIQLSPDTRLTGWDGCSAYHYSDSVIYGFSHTHLSGTGCSDYGDVLISPFYNKASIINTEYAHLFYHDSEKASPGYYFVELFPLKSNKSDKIIAELTVSHRVGLHRYTFPDSINKKGIVLDLQHRDKVLYSSIVFDKKENSIYGIRNSSAWNPNQKLAYSLLFSKKIEKVEFYSDNKLVTTKNIDNIIGTNCKAIVYFNDSTDQVVIKVAISANTEEKNAALVNQTDVADFDFDMIKKETDNLWNKELSKIEVFSSDITKKQIFYTALYHCFTAPNLYNDTNGSYLGHDSKIHKTEEENIYTVFSLWDTYRALHPLLNIIDKKRSKDFIYTFMKNYEYGGILPVWELAAFETWCMIGYHSVPVIYDAWKKNIVTHNKEKILQAMIHSAKLNKLGRPEFAKYGYIPGDMEHEDISKTLEYAYDDWCIAQFAKEIGNLSVYKEFIERCQYWKNIMDSNGFMHSKINGAFIEPFDPAEINNHITEGNSWQYSTYVPHDFLTWINYTGGDNKAEAFLDSLFNTTKKTSGRDQVDVTGLIGQYAHGNEPSHHAAYLYNFVGKQYKTAKIARKIMTELYTNKPDGLCGNEDCGQMSAWYIFSSIGFYPVCPGDNQYVLGSPVFDKAIIHLENGKSFTINCQNQSDENKYIKSAKINGKNLKNSYITYKDIDEGGTLNIKMSKFPNKNFGNKPENRPVSSVNDNKIVLNPVIKPYTQTFEKDLTVSLYLPFEESANIYYSTDGLLPTKNSKKYTSPFTIDTTTFIRAVAYNKNSGKYSKVVDAQYIKFEKDKKITILSNCSKMYSAGGPEALIDGLRGKKNFSLGGWQGYQGQDFEAIIDLEKVKNISEIGASFLQSSRSWIIFPKSLNIEISTNGKDYSQYGIYINNYPANNYDEIIKEFIIKKEAVARYIKLKAVNFGILPEWHQGAGGNAFIFIDEILIL